MAGTSSSGRPSERSQIEVHGVQSPPSKPSDLVGVHANELWDIAVESLSHVLRPIDFAILRQCCEVYELFRTTDDLKTKLSASRLFVNLSKQIGLDPSSRRVIKPAKDPKPEPEKDPFDAWLERGGLN